MPNSSTDKSRPYFRINNEIWLLLGLSQKKNSFHGNSFLVQKFVVLVWLLKSSEKKVAYGFSFKIILYKLSKFSMNSKNWGELAFEIGFL